MKTLDLHGVRHGEVNDLVDSFIGKYFHMLSIEIITGNSVDMQKIVKNIIKSYKLKMEPENHMNLGSCIISHE